MNLRLSLVAPCLLLSLSACGEDGGSGPGDGGNGADARQPDAYVPPVANCNALDLAAAPVVTIVSNQQITPAPTGGAVTAGIYELTGVRLYASGIPVTGTAQARVEIVTGNATTGAARVAVSLDAMALGNPVQENITGAGLYTIAGTALTVADGCGGSEPLPVLSYSASGTGLTMWTEYMITDPVALTIPIELVLAAE